MCVSVNFDKDKGVPLIGGTLALKGLGKADGDALDIEELMVSHTASHAME